MKRTPFVVGNWKLNKSIQEATALVTELKNQLGTVRDVEIGIAPVFTAIQAVRRRLEDSSIDVVAQDCHWENSGAFTGAVGPAHLRDAGASWVIIGHSERRQLFGETDEGVAKKVRAALEGGLGAIVCVGETDAQREAGQTMQVVGKQVHDGLAQIHRNDMGRLVLAYEPVWAIGTGKTATPAQAQEVHKFIRGQLEEICGGCSKTVRIQYGGSVKPDNAESLMREPDIDGALVGGASLKADDFVAIVKATRLASAS